MSSPARLGTTLNVPSFALSPDGRTLVFSAATPGSRPMLWLRSLDHVEALQLAGTEDRGRPILVAGQPLDRLLRWGRAERRSASGGAVQVITELSGDFRGATWGARDTILLAAGSDGIVSVNAAGGTTAPVTAASARQENNIATPRSYRMGVISCIRDWQRRSKRGLRRIAGWQNQETDSAGPDERGVRTTRIRAVRERRHADRAGLRRGAPRSDRPPDSSWPSTSAEAHPS